MVYVFIIHRQTREGVIPTTLSTFSVATFVLNEGSSFTTSCIYHQQINHVIQIFINKILTWFCIEFWVSLLNTNPIGKASLEDNGSIIFWGVLNNDNVDRWFRLDK